MSKLLIKYGKSGPLRYLSHLELIRAMERSFRRANIDIRVSKGFNPRPKISHGLALPVGVGSIAEYMMIEMADHYAFGNDILQKLSSAFPEGLSLYGAKYIEGKQSSITSVVQSAAYRVKAKFGSDTGDIKSLIAQLRNEDRLLIRHKDKEKWVETNKAILDWKVERESENIYDSFMLLSVNNQDSLRPEVAINKLSEMFSELGGVELTEVYRIEQYVNRGDPLINIYNFYEGVTMGSEHTKS